MAGRAPTAALTRFARAAALRARKYLPPRPAILMYHRVAHERFDPWGLAVSPDNFAAQVEWIARNRTPLPLVEMAALAGTGRLPRDGIALTFDDGYACNLQAAVPVLERFGVPATIFVPAALIGAGREFWWDELQRLVLETDHDLLRLDGREFPIGRKDDRDRDWPQGEEPQTERQKAYAGLWSSLHAMAPGERDALMEQLRSQANVSAEPRPTHRPMTAEEIGSDRSRLIDFGSHAMTHASLPALSPAAKEAEIHGSMERCAALTGVRPRAFAYPYGDLDAQSERLVEEAGFACACSTEGAFVTSRSRPFALPRIWIGDWDARRLARLLGAA